MKTHKVVVCPPGKRLASPDQLAWKIAEKFLQSVDALSQAGPRDVAGLCLPVREDNLIERGPAGLFRPAGR